MVRLLAAGLSRVPHITLSSQQSEEWLASKSPRKAGNKSSQQLLREAKELRIGDTNILCSSNDREGVGQTDNSSNHEPRTSIPTGT
jgi:hypothetical protein